MVSWVVEVQYPQISDADIASLDTLNTRIHDVPLLWLPHRGTYDFREEKQGDKTLGVTEHLLPAAKPRRGEGRPVQPVAQSDGLNEILRLILTPPPTQLINSVDLPEELRQYQIEGMVFLFKTKRALLADDMGVGKTIQAIVALRLLKRATPDKQMRSLIVCPASLETNWIMEMKKWAPPAQHALRIEGPKQTRVSQWRAPWEVKICSYNEMRLDTALAVAGGPWDLVILDEPEPLKNPDNEAARAFRKIPTDRVWCLTGTPISNKVEDLIGIFDGLCPGLLTGVAPTNISAIQRLIAPHFMRRTREQVLPDLPQVDVNDIRVELKPSQRAAYDRVEREKKAYLKELGREVTLFHVFQVINELKQVCNFDPVTGDSAKADALADELRRLAPAQKALIFSQYVKTLQLLSTRIGREISSGPLLFHGGLSGKEKDRVIHAFKDLTQRHPVLLISFKAGGMGLNLQEASYVFLFDQWWTFVTESQAIGRVHRFGQSAKVTVRRLLTLNTIEQRIKEKVEKKRRLFRALFEEMPYDLAYALSPEEIFEIMDLDPALARSRATRAVYGLPSMAPIEFEALVGQIYRRLGYSVRVTPPSGDRGVDIWAERSTAAEASLLIVQCKLQSNSVGPAPVRELVGTLSMNASATGGILVSASGFTRGAREEAAAAGRVTLRDAAWIVAACREYGGVAKVLAAARQEGH